MAGDDHPLAPAEAGTRHDQVLVPPDLQVVVRTERGLNRVRDRSLVAANRLDVDELTEQCHEIATEVEHHGVTLARVYPCPTRQQRRRPPREPPPGGASPRFTPPDRCWTPISPTHGSTP